MQAEKEQRAMWTREIPRRPRGAVLLPARVGVGAGRGGRGLLHVALGGALRPPGGQVG